MSANEASAKEKNRLDAVRKGGRDALFSNYRKEQGKDGKAVSIKTSQCLFLTFVVTILSVLQSAFLNELQRQSDDLRAIATTLPAPCAVARPGLSGMMDLLGGAEDPQGLATSVLCASRSKEPSFEWTGSRTFDASDKGQCFLSDEAGAANLPVGTDLYTFEVDFENLQPGFETAFFFYGNGDWNSHQMPQGRIHGIYLTPGVNVKHLVHWGTDPTRGYSQSTGGPVVPTTGRVTTTYDGAYRRIYLDGSLVHQHALVRANGPSVEDANNFCLGSASVTSGTDRSMETDPPHYTDGTITAFRAWKNAFLTTADVEARGGKGQSEQPVYTAASAVSDLYKGMVGNQSTASLKQAICERTAGAEDSLERISRAYLNSQSLMRAYKRRSDTSVCTWDKDPFRSVATCPLANHIKTEIKAHAEGEVAQAVVNAMPDPVVALYRMLALSVLAESDRKHNQGKCLGNYRHMTADELCSDLWLGETITSEATLSSIDGERGAFDRYYDATHLQHCSSFGGQEPASLVSPAPPPPPFAHLSNPGYTVGRQQCVYLHTIGPWNVDYLFGVPDLRRHALPFGGDSFARSIGGWLFKIVEDNLTNDLITNPQRVALLYALYRKAAFYVWFVPTLYVLGWYVPCGILPLLFIALRPLTKACCPKLATSRLGQVLDDVPIVVPPFGVNRYLAAATAVLTLAYVMVVHPAPADAVSRPSCQDADGLVFATTNTDGAYQIVYGLSITFAASFVFYTLFIDSEERLLSKGAPTEASRRSSVRAISLLVALVALPGAVVALVDAGEDAVETIGVTAYSSTQVLEKIERFIDMSDILTYTAFFHGVAVGIWSNGWIVDHGSVNKEGAPLGSMKIMIPLASALAAFAPRFKKYTSQRDTWFPPDDGLGVIDVFAYIAEIGLTVVALLAMSQKLATIPDMKSYQETFLSYLRRDRGKVTAAADPDLKPRPPTRAGAIANLQANEDQPFLFDHERRGLPTLSSLCV